MKNYVWHKQSISSELELIDCPSYDPIKNFHRDPTGAYVLIRCDIEKSLIETAICDKKHTIIKVFRGHKAQDLYYTIFEYELKHKLKWFSRKDHAAYLGKELKKAELALSGNESYVQE
jgi:dihydropteroate synthase